MYSAKMRVVVVLLFFAFSAESFSIRHRRSASNPTTGGGRVHKSMEGVGISKTPEVKSCVVTLNRCKHNKECREALKGIKSKCAVKAGTCNANMRDLPVCAEIKDKLAEFFDLGQTCSCDRSTERCARVHETIYRNPCFGSVEYLRSMNLLPTFEESASPIHTLPPKAAMITGDVIEELFGSSEDIGVSDEFESVVVTSQAPKEEVEEVPTEKAAMLDSDVTKGIKTQFEPVYVVTRDDYVRDDHPTHGSPHSETLLLHVVAIATGVLMVVMLTIGAGLLVYFSMSRKGSNPEKSATMT